MLRFQSAVPPGHTRFALLKGPVLITMVIMRRVVFLLSLAASAAAAYLPAASCSRPLPTVPRSRVVRGAVALASKPLEESAGGNYAVGGGAWPAREARPPRAKRRRSATEREGGVLVRRRRGSW